MKYLIAIVAALIVTIIGPALEWLDSKLDDIARNRVEWEP